MPKAKRQSKLKLPPKEKRYGDDFVFPSECAALDSLIEAGANRHVKLSRVQKKFLAAHINDCRECRISFHRYRVDHEIHEEASQALALAEFWDNNPDLEPEGNA